ncbi:uncharacterized protein LOC129292074 [Prosopis cineraria]|uniref:uncharacterized protein LOC129292074 n=1 Tax=Prosopis cineraria TaxID=364024 RepID=UPI00240EFCCB|nr:uncharacterized protein LOC129292074 [Prosopis cineraria]XP_054785561.1 uncharacterized protein LOC129292074 [Prosopis cineraria]XP_054785562.1 uncharacterized protein LOC129292074 [Prosopis cineraria]XP_054785564.1 uncharacterized protein LOC129292074 [Prosopis cineraria]
MHEFSTVDGFVEISECLAEMIKFVANEPSVGLFFVQQHAHNAVPNVVKLTRNVAEKSHETTLHTEDFEDSITMLRSMKECGFSIADEMMGDIKKSLVTMTTKQPKRGTIQPWTSDFETQRASSWGNTPFYALEGREKRGNYFSSVLKSAKQKASSLKWRHLDPWGPMDCNDDKPLLFTNPALSVASSSTTSSLQGMETDELPLSIQVEDESQQPEENGTADCGSKLLLVSEKYDDFKADKEAKLEDWLEGNNS